MSLSKRIVAAFALVALVAFASAVASSGRIYGNKIDNVDEFYKKFLLAVSLPAWWSGGGVFKVPGQRLQREVSAGDCKTFFQVLESRPELSKLRALEGSLAQSLRNQLVATGDENPVTIFAPNDKAIENFDKVLGEGQNPQWRRNGNLASALLGYHTVPGTKFSAKDMTNGQYLYNGLMSNAEGSFIPPLTVAKDIQNVIIQGVGSEGSVVTADIPICRGVVHIVDQVLIPVETAGSEQEATVRAQINELQRIKKLQTLAPAPAST